MNWTLTIVLGLLLIYLLTETATGRTVTERFVVPRRSDIGLTRDGWGEEGNWSRDLRYSEAFVDIAGRGVAADFCRAVRRHGDPGSLRMACALGGRDGMDTIEYTTATAKEGFRFSRDDYWRVGTNNRMDYCRILHDAQTDEWFSSCAIAGPDSFKKIEEHDTAPPPTIVALLDAYEGIMVWWRWRDDELDYAGDHCTYEKRGHPEFSTLLKPVVSRGMQLNRTRGHILEPAIDHLRWGEKGTLALNDVVIPRQIRAIAFWVYWDVVEKGATILEASNGHKKNMLRLFVEGGGQDLPSASEAVQAAEVRPAHRLAIGQLTEPGQMHPPRANPAPTTIPLERSGAYVFEIWDEDQRLMRLESGAGGVVAETWQHVVVTTTDSTTFWPTWSMYINGRLVGEKRDGRASPAMDLTQNYIGKNMRACLQDFRIYRLPMTEAKIEAAIAWGMPMLHPNP